MKTLTAILSLLAFLAVQNTASAIYITYQYANPACGNSKGYIHASASNGVSPYSYQWSSGQTTAAIDNLLPGSYTLTVHDAVNATATLTVTLVNSPTLDNGALSYVVPMQVGTGLAHPCNSQCNGIGFLNVQDLNGTPPYSMVTSLLHPFGFYGPTQIPAVQNICSNDVYTVTVTDGQGCTGMAWPTFDYAPTSFANVAQVFGWCNGNVGRAIFEFTNTGGIPYMATWSGPESGSRLIQYFPPILTLDTLTPGNYTLTISNTYTYTACDTVINFNIPNIGTGTVPAAPGSISATGGNTKVCPGTTKTYSISLVTGATSYTWTPPLGGLITSGQGSNLITVYYSNSFTASDTLRVVSNNSCGSSAQRKLKITRNNPGVPSAIAATGGNTKVCPGNSKTYSITSVTGATSYTWFPPTGGVITSGQGTTSVNILFNSGFVASDTLQVRSNNACGSSAKRNLIIYRNNPASPSAVSGQNYSLCNVSGIPYSVTPVAGMTYNWSFNAPGATVTAGQGSSNVTANFGGAFISATLSVTATNGCGTSAARNKVVYAKPPTPPSITGTTSVCLNQQDVPYSITPIPNILNYTWTGPSGSHISDGINTSPGATLVTTSPSVIVDFATTAGSVKVRANNSCALGSYKSLAVAITCRESITETTVEDFEATVLPNPNNGSFTVQLAGASDATAHGTITDLVGNKLHEFELLNRQVLDLNLELSPGIYFIDLSDSKNKVVKTIVVQ